MKRRITAASLILAAACAGTGSIFRGPSLSYAQYCSLEKGMRVETIRKGLGPGGDVLETDGKVRGLAYPCEDAEGKVLQLRMVFSEDGRLEKWVLKDPKAPASEEPKGNTAEEPGTPPKPA